MISRSNPGRLVLSTIVLAAFCIPSYSQQVPDTSYLPAVKNVQEGKGTTVVIDEAHNNFHTVDGRYSPFAKVLRNSGYTVKGNTQLFTNQDLKNVNILVIANAINKHNLNQWRLPNPSAFTKEEIVAVNKWVMDGGSLFLIADHMPFAGAAAELAESFGFHFYNGFAMDTTKKNAGDIFTTAEKTLANLEALSPDNLDSIATFTGQAFDIPGNAISILNFDHRYTLLMPEEAWAFEKNTSRLPAKGKSQLAILQYGKGKLVVSGEAAMFTAQIAGGSKKLGMNSPEGRNNYRLLLAIMKWLRL